MPANATYCTSQDLNGGQYLEPPCLHGSRNVVFILPGKLAHQKRPPLTRAQGHKEKRTKGNEKTKNTGTLPSCPHTVLGCHIISALLFVPLYRRCTQTFPMPHGRESGRRSGAGVVAALAATKPQPPLWRFCFVLFVFLAALGVPVVA